MKKTHSECLELRLSNVKRIMKIGSVLEVIWHFDQNICNTRQMIVVASHYR
jgi:hypothetical protein